MKIPFQYSVSVVIVVAFFTLLTRALPFLLFGGKKEAPGWVRFIGKALSPAIIAILVLYCLKEVPYSDLQVWLPQILASVCVMILHLWKKNILLSVGGGTIFYMILIQVIFV